MLADTAAVVGIVATFIFVVFTLAVVLYAIVRPFTHLHHEHESNLWVHLP